MSKHHLTLPFTALTLIFTNLANGNQQVLPASERLDQSEQQNIPEVRIDPHRPLIVRSDTAHQKNTLSISKEELAKHPDLIIRALIPAVSQNNSEAVALLFPLYQQQANTDPTLILWCKAILAAKEENYQQSIDFYREIISHYPQITPVRFQLAQVLYLNYDNEAALDQFTKLRSEPLSSITYQVIDNYINALKKRQSWRFYGGMSYVKDNNINNAPKPDTYIRNWKAWDSESAEGFLYNLGASKQWEIKNSYFTQLDLDLIGRYYWDNKKYNELEFRTGLGVGYHNAYFETLLMPFTSKRWYGGGASGSHSLKEFSQNSGVRLSSSYWLNNQWKLANTLEYSEIRYKTRKHLNGNRYFDDISLLYIPKSTQIWFIGTNYYRSNARDKDDAFNRVGIRIGWVQEWDLGLSTRLVFNYAQRRYLAAGRMFAKKQIDHEYSPQLTLWHRNLKFFGITPQITWEYNKVNSNNPFYSYDKHNIYFNFSKSF
ncbi:surface lipoprotein assembly modifier [Gallibacterium anatis]|uniref:surface lipoprotein assembly modifier n=1 Tax=Gallibacterium anatis TaxID=750 RepID=UPI0009B91F97|nr:surface lipoprotein assembly modifier [Gallibacterium anatis]